MDLGQNRILDIICPGKIFASGNSQNPQRVDSKYELLENQTTGQKPGSRGMKVSKNHARLLQNHIAKELI